MFKAKIISMGTLIIKCHISYSFDANSAIYVFNYSDPEIEDTAHLISYNDDNTPPFLDEIEKIGTKKKFSSLTYCDTEIEDELESQNILEYTKTKINNKRQFLENRIFQIEVIFYKIGKTQLEKIWEELE